MTVRPEATSPLLPARTAAWLAIALLTLAASACSDDEAGDGPSDTGDEATVDAGNDAAPDAPATSWEATLYRVDALIIDQPASLGQIIGELISRDINSGLLNILVETGQFQATSGATDFEIRGGAGETDDAGSTYRLVNDVAWVPASVDANGDFRNDELLTLDFPVLLQLPPDCGDQDCPDDRCRDDDDCDSPYTCDLGGDGQCVQDIVLPLKEIRITGTFEAGDDGAAVLNLATLDGAILKVDADAIIVGLPTGDPLVLTSLLNEDRMNYPDRDNPTGWELSALINAAAVTPAE